ncbi:MAG: WbqC family protein [Nitrospinae bacterium]|nr:WbqC family protein [Nitrospinota bacterium]
MNNMAITVVILQPGYLPWLGFFDQMYKSDIFVILDDAQYDKHSWRNRNRIKTSQGAQWLTVPVLISGKNKPITKDVLIDNRTSWQKKHLKSIEQNYKKSQFFKYYFNIFEEVLSKEWKYLIDLDMEFIYRLNAIIGLNRKIIFASDLNIKTDKTERLINICSLLGTSKYLTGDAAKDYINKGEFVKHNIQLEFHNYSHPTYKQLYGEFIPFLSIIDLLFNCGGESLEILTGKNKVTSSSG